jgi:hypothetical protein
MFLHHLNTVRCDSILAGTQHIQINPLFSAKRTRITSKEAPARLLRGFLKLKAAAYAQKRGRCAHHTKTPQAPRHCGVYVYSM